MKLAVVFPSALYHERKQGIAKFIQEVERIGFDHLDFREDPVSLSGTRPKPALEVLATLGFAAGITSTLGLGTRALELARRETMLVAEQVRTLSIMSRGRVRLGISLGRWEIHHSREERIDDAITLLRSHWRGETQSFDGAYYRSEVPLIAPAPGDIPIWIGGSEPEALERAGRYANGWTGAGAKDGAQVRMVVQMIRHHAAQAGRDPKTIDLQFALAPFARESQEGFFCDPHRLIARLVELQALGFNWVSIDLGSAYPGESVDRLVKHSESLYETLQTGL